MLALIGTWVVFDARDDANTQLARGCRVRALRNKIRWLTKVELFIQ